MVKKTLFLMFWLVWPSMLGCQPIFANIWPFFRFFLAYFLMNVLGQQSVFSRCSRTALLLPQSLATGPNRRHGVRIEQPFRVTYCNRGSPHPLPKESPLPPVVPTRTKPEAWKAALDLRAQLRRRGLSCPGCVDKADVLAVLRRHAAEVAEQMAVTRQLFLQFRNPPGPGVGLGLSPPPPEGVHQVLVWID